jgi:hypothetical protein
VAVVEPDRLDAGQRELLAGLGGAVEVTAAGAEWIGLLPRGGAAGVAAQVLAESPGSATFSVENPSDHARVLDFAMVWAPGWEVEVDGARAELLAVDGVVMGVRVPPGQHEVRFEYHAPGLAAGVALTVAGLVVVLGSGVVTVARRRRGGGEAE